MERIFGTQNAGYGQMVLGFARSVKAKVSDLLTALKLPKPLVNVLTWGVMLTLALTLLGLIAFVTFIYFMIKNSYKKNETGQHVDICPEPEMDLDLELGGPEMHLDYDPTLPWHYARNK